MVITILALSVGLLVFLVSLPLIYRKVPMNGLYGIRIDEAFESEEKWYEINAYGGRQLAKWSLLIIATGIAGFWVPPRHVVTYSTVFAVVSLIAVLVPLVQILKWSDRSRSDKQE